MSVTPTNAQQQFTSATAPYSVKSLLEAFKTDAAISLNCHHVGTIQSFDPNTQTATASINYLKTAFQYDAATNANVPVQINYPLLAMCPVICLGGGKASLTFPIQAGDECLILFNDRSLDNWFQSGTLQPLNSPRLHSISDGIILVGLRNSQKVLSNYDMTRAVLKNNQAEVGVGPSLIKIANNLTSLKTVLENLISAIESATYGGNSLDSPAGLEAVRALVAGLLE